MKVRQFYNKNQFIITGNGATVFQSYDSTIAKIDANGVLSFGSDWDYSATTKKHLYLFLNDYKCLIDNFQYSQLFSKGFSESKNKTAFLNNLIKKKVINISL